MSIKKRICRKWGSDAKKAQIENHELKLIKEYKEYKNSFIFFWTGIKDYYSIHFYLLFRVWYLYCRRLYSLFFGKFVVLSFA